VALATYVVAGAVSTAFLFAAPDALRLLFREEPVSTRTMILFACLLFLNLIRTVDDTYITARGAFDVAYYLPVLEGPTYIALGVVLSRRMGMEGVIWAGLVTNLLFAVLAKTAVIARGVLMQPIWRLGRLRVFNGVVAAMVTAPLVLLDLWARHVSGRAMLHLVLIGAPVVVYACVLALAIIKHGFRESGELLARDVMSGEAA
jgi:hypothetical protein